jgi:rare lipoprotein A (peptidoglycan hydrolase)
MNNRLSMVGAMLLTCSLASHVSVLSQERYLDNESVAPEQAEKIPALPPSKQTGLAAFYHMAFQGRSTANGEFFDHDKLTAAHKTLPFGTLVRVINLQNNKSIIVRVNDRGPLQLDRVIDVTRRAAGLLGFIQQGMTRVALEILPLGTPEK